MLEVTGCDGVMVGRAAISNPWALGRITAAVNGWPIPCEPTLNERIEIALEHLRMMICFHADTNDFEEALKSEQAELWACRHMRGQIPLYIKSAPGAAEIRNRLHHSNTYAEVSEILTLSLAKQKNIGS
jgi:tRNA-dihydrouridine synthase